MNDFTALDITDKLIFPHYDREDLFKDHAGRTREERIREFETLENPKYHGRGIGSRLINHAEKVKGSNLQVDVNEQNEGAYTFYKRFGFVQTGRSELDRSGRLFPLLHLILKSYVNG